MSIADPAVFVAAPGRSSRVPDRAESNPAPALDGETVLQLLDDPLEWATFSVAQGDRANMWESRLVIEGMRCAACAVSIEEALLQVPGVESVEVNVGSMRARVIWSADRVLPSRWMKAVQRAGYRAVPANDSMARDRRSREARQALWRLAVAGLCMMQVMMYAYPAYVARPGDLTPEMEHLLRWASWVLTLPVMLFSSGPFFRSAAHDVLQRRVSMDLPVALGILITFAVSTAGTFDFEGPAGREVYFDSLTMFVFFLLLGRWMELRLRGRAAGALETLMNRLPDSVLRLHQGGSYERVSVRRLQVGDLIRVLPGETFPADGLVLQGQTTVDEALLTGESRALARSVGQSVIAGSHNLSGGVQVRIERIGEHTRFAQIVALMESASSTRPRLARVVDRFAKPFLVGVLLAAGLACGYWWQQDPVKALMVAVAVLVVTCPCALSLATPAALLAAAANLAQTGVLVRRLDALEALAGVDTVVFDKTGTLTTDALVLGVVHTRAGLEMTQALAMASGLAEHSLHPLSRAIVRCASQQLAGTSQRWRAVAVSESVGQGLEGRVAIGDSIGHGVVLRLGSARFCDVVSGSTDAAQVFLSDEHGWLGTFEFHEQLRGDASATVAALRRLGVEVHLVSGDTAQSVSRVAAAVGVTGFGANVTPQGKLDFLHARQREGHKVAVVGDGLNDGPALAGADASFAFGQHTPLAQARSDFVVPGEQLGAVAGAIGLARKTMRVVRQNLWWAMLYNAVCVPLAMFGWLPAWAAGLGMASSSLLVVLNAARLSSGTQQTGII